MQGIGEEHGKVFSCEGAQGDPVAELDFGFLLSGIQHLVDSEQENDFFSITVHVEHISVNTAYVRIVPDVFPLSTRPGGALNGFIFFVGIMVRHMVSCPPGPGSLLTNIDCNVDKRNDAPIIQIWLPFDVV
jgi:hypothetical protein